MDSKSMDASPPTSGKSDGPVSAKSEPSNGEASAPEPIHMLHIGGRWISEGEIERRRKKSEEEQRRAEVERAARERI